MFRSSVCVLFICSCFIQAARLSLGPRPAFPSANFQSAAPLAPNERTHTCVALASLRRQAIPSIPLLQPGAPALLLAAASLPRTNLHLPLLPQPLPGCHPWRAICFHRLACCKWINLMGATRACPKYEEQEEWKAVAGASERTQQRWGAEQEGTLVMWHPPLAKLAAWRSAEQRGRATFSRHANKR